MTDFAQELRRFRPTKGSSGEVSCALILLVLPITSIIITGATSG